jgi:hypothetical protein
MEDAGLRAKVLFWALALALLALTAAPTMLIVEKARDYYRFVTGWQPSPPRQGSTGRTPSRDSIDEGPASEIRFVEFSLEAPRAKSVRLLGSFNHWQAQAPMRRKGRLWKAVIPLPPGQHGYAFEVDGAWTPDPKNPERTACEGKPASALHVH